MTQLIDRTRLSQQQVISLLRYYNTTNKTEEALIMLLQKAYIMGRNSDIVHTKIKEK